MARQQPPVLSEVVVGAPEVPPGVRRAVLQSVGQPRDTMTEVEVTRKPPSLEG